MIACGDFNVAHREIDLKNPEDQQEERRIHRRGAPEMAQLQDAGFTDTFRYFYPDLEGAYSWWSYRFNARKNNAGWRIDYFLTSKALNKTAAEG